ncbi:hypothetical protein OAX78_02805 [Planctomycetota bacterium]|nr:hypothetical protein [Planctomycetota bacterium]
MLKRQSALPLAYVNLGCLLADEDELNEARDAFLQAQTSAEEQVAAGREEQRMLVARAAQFLGNVLYELEDYDGALERYAAARAMYDALELSDEVDGLAAMADLESGVGLVHVLRVDHAEAVVHLEEALELQARLAKATGEDMWDEAAFAEVSHNLGIALLEQDQTDAAIEHMSNAVAVYDDLVAEAAAVFLEPAAKAANNLAQALTKAGKAADALAQLQKAKAHYDRLVAEGGEEFQSDATTVAKNLEDAQAAAAE